MNYRRIAVMAAMDKEMSLLLPLLGAEATTVADPSTPGSEIVGGKYNGATIALMKSGIGKVNAALATQSLLTTFMPELVISTGVAGGVGAAGVLDVVVADRLTFSDVWCGPGTEPGAADGCPRFFTPPSSLLALDCLKPREGVRQGLICSGDRFISTAAEVEHIVADFPDAQAVEMESGAIAQTCFRHATDMIAIRVVSDTPGQEDNISQYRDFWSVAPERTFALVKGLLDTLTAHNI